MINQDAGMNLKEWDIVLINTSAGKDSQAMSEYVCRLAREQGVLDRVVMVHADLGRVEWKGTKELAGEHAAHYGVPIFYVKRPQGDLLDQIEARGMFPDPKNRYCTSDQKRTQVAKLITQLTLEKLSAGLGRRVRILSCMGFRKEESSARAKKPAMQLDARNTNSKREVYIWLPIHDWTVGEVWSTIKASGVKYHYAYDLGMPRLSCCFCIFAPRAALLLAGKHNPELLDQYVAVEEKIGHTFKNGFALASIKDALAAGEQPVPVQSWIM